MKKVAKFESFEQVEEAVGVLAAGHMELEAALNVNLKLGELVRAQDEQIKLLIALVDQHQAVLVAAGLATPRPQETKRNSRFEN